MEVFTYRAWLMVLLWGLLGCGQQLEKFLNEDKDIQLTGVSETFTADANGALVSITFSADREIVYSVKFGSSCDTATISLVAPVSGTALSGEVVTVKVYFRDLVANGNRVLICISDKANYKTTVIDKTFPNSSLAATVTYYNETYGASGAPMSSGLTTSFQMFQVEQAAPNWTNALTDRDGNGFAKINGVNANSGLLVAIDPNDNYKLKMFVVDGGNNRILIFNSIPTSNAVNPDVVVGQGDFVSRAAPAPAASSLNTPRAVAVCADGKMFIADRGNNRVAGFNAIPKTNGAPMDFVIGQTSPTVSAAATTANGLSGPAGVSCISSKLFVVDRGNHRVVVFSPIPTATNAVASYAIGQPNLTTASTATWNAFANPSYLNSPWQVLYSGSQFFIADAGNSRVLVYSSLPTAPGAAASFVIGQTGPALISGNQCGCATPTQSSFDTPRTLAFRSGKLAVGDDANERIMFFDLPIAANGATATHQLGQPNFTTAPSQPVKQGTFISPLRDIIFDGNFIWVQDAGNNRLQFLPLPF